MNLISYYAKKHVTNLNAELLIPGEMHRLGSETGDSGVADTELNPVVINTGTGGHPTGIEPHPLGNVPTINAGLLFLYTHTILMEFGNVSDRDTAMFRN